MKGLISNIERYAINDGFGLRTTVFMKGCPLTCRWCCNPETQKPFPEMVFFQDKCIGCGMCAQDCPQGAIGADVKADRSKCETCYQRKDAFACTQRCYAQCRKQSGEEMDIQQVIAVVERDMALYRRSGGGVTLSGGEPLLQGEFAVALAEQLTKRRMDVAIETCGAAREEDCQRIAPYLSFAFFDIKHMDTKKHCHWIGVGNEYILHNAILLDSLAGKYGFGLVYRVPVVPKYNDTPEEIAAICRFLKAKAKHYKGMELLPYHKLGRGKYESLGRSYPMGKATPPSEEKMEALYKVLAEQGISRYQF